LCERVVVVVVLRVRPGLSAGLWAEPEAIVGETGGGQVEGMCLDSGLGR
jgi:hypothetical protein